MVPTGLGDDPKHVTTELEEPPVEGDEGTQLRDRVPGVVLQLCDRPADVGALLRRVDQRAREPALVPYTL